MVRGIVWSSALSVLFGFAQGCDRAVSAEPAPLSARPAASAAELTGTKLEDGDLIFQESTSRQSDMVRALTGSRYTHMGIVFVDTAGPVVLEAASTVRRTPLDAWIVHGRERHFVVKRLKHAESRLNADVVRAMRLLGERWLGRPYDLQFRWGDDSLYCSELAHKLFERAAQVKLGRVERARDMNLEDERVQRALHKRFAAGSFDPNEPVVTPGSIFDDAELVTVLER
jgi:hypothetical protein